MSNGGALPPEILTDVLSRLPVKSLCRFKSVSPSWKSLISDPYFAKTHLNRTNNEDPNHLDRKIILISSSSHHLYSVDLARVNPVATPLDFPTLEQHAVDEWVKVWNSCDGLLLVSYNDNNSNFLLLNPSTRECKKLPALPFVPCPVCGFMVNFYGVGYDSSTDDYKVVILSYSSRFEETIVAVYSLKTDAWRRIQDLPYVLLASGSVVFFNGCLHCFCYRIDSYAMVAFDLSDEILREVPLPAPSIDYKITYYHLAVLGDCLCLVIKQRSSQVDVWLMKEYGIRDSWKKVTFDMPKTNTMKLSCFLAEDELLMKNEEWRLDRGCKEKLVVYNWKDETMRDVAVCGIPTEFTFGGTYVESILSPHHGGIWRQ